MGKFLGITNENTLCPKCGKKGHSPLGAISYDDVTETIGMYCKNCKYKWRAGVSTLSGRDEDDFLQSLVNGE